MRKARFMAGLGGIAGVATVSLGVLMGEAVATAPAAGQPAAQVGASNSPVVVTDPVVSAVDTSLPAAFLKDPLRLSTAAIDTWLQDPKTLFASYPLGGPALVSYVRLLVGSDSRTVAALISLAKDASATNVQIEGIAKGLARASQSGQVIAPAYTAYIQRLVAESGSTALIAAFSAALSDPETSELAPGGGLTGGAASVSPGTLTGTGGIGPSGSVGGTGAVASSSGSFSVGGGSVSGSGNGGTIQTEISPTR